MFAVNICLGQGPSVARWPIGQYPQRSMEISNPVVGGIKRPILSAHHWMTRSISHRPIARNSRRLETLDYFSPIKMPTSPVLEHWQVLVECLKLYSLKFVLDGTTLGFVGFQLVYLKFFSFGANFFSSGARRMIRLAPHGADDFCPFESDIWRRRFFFSLKDVVELHFNTFPSISTQMTYLTLSLSRDGYLVDFHSSGVS